MEAAMVLSEGDQVHVITRRMFDGDMRRHFAGKVEAVSGDIARLRGFAFVFATRNQFVVLRLNG